MERLVVVACPDLFAEDEGGEVLRTFAWLIDAVERYCPWVIAVRAGVCALPARGPARYFGGEVAVAGLVHDAAASVAGIGLVEVGVADGLFAARLAADAGLVVPPGQTPAFLARWPVTTLGRPDLADLLRRLGITTLGGLARLPERDVSARLGVDGARCHRVARGLDGELPGTRDPGIERRLAGLDRRAAPGVRQRGFWGGAGGTASATTQALGAVQSLVGADGVQVARQMGGRMPPDQARFVTWTPEPAPARPAPPAPWPGRLPSPAPALVHAEPRRLALVGPDDRPVVVTGHGELTCPPARLSVEGGPWAVVSGWAGPWLSVERWWLPGPRRAAWMQVVLGTGAAHLLRWDAGQWRFAATYD